MSSLIKLQPRNDHFDNYLKDVQAGIIQVPEFQRDFVWELENVLSLLSSIKKNYPIGSFLFWKPEEKFRIAKEIGPYILRSDVQDAFEKVNCKYILDGYQRISSLFGCLMNPNKVLNFFLQEDLYKSTFDICYNLDSEEFEIYRGKERESFIVPVYVLLDYEMFLTISEKIYKEYPSSAKILTDRLKQIVTTFERYQMPVVEIAGGSLEEAIDVFTLLNKEGKPITPDWVLSAKTYNKDFRLADKIDIVLEKIEKYNFIDKKPKEFAVRELIFRSIQSSFGDLYLDNKKTNILELSKKENFIEQIENTIDSIEKTVKFLFEELLVVDNKLLPANLQFIFLVEFFNHIKEPTDLQINQLKNWFWITSYSNYFTIYNPSKRKEAFKHFQNYIKGKEQNPVYNDKPEIRFKVPELQKKITLGSVRSKAHVLFQLNYSNQFSKISSEIIDGYKIHKLLPISTVEPLINEYGENCNLIITLDDISLKQESKNYSLLLTSNDNLDNLFISNQMKDYYQKSDFTSILSMRKKIIMDKEKAFIKEFDLEVH